MLQFISRYTTVIRWISVIVIVGSLLLLIKALPLAQLLQGARAWIEGAGVWAPLALGGVYVVATVLLVPAWPLTLLAGAMFGLLVGTVTASIASTLGAALAFLIARYLLRGKVAAYVQRRPKLGALDAAIGEAGWKMVALLRLSPVVPFNVQNYFYGVTPVRFLPYVITSWVAMLPGTFMYVYIGHISGAALATDRQRTTAEWMALAVGLLATIVLTVYLTWLARRKLREHAGEAAGPAPAPQERPRRAWGALVTASVAIILAVTAGIAQANQEAVSTYFTGLFGPPRQVKTVEAYPQRDDGPTFDHSPLNELLKKHVHEDGMVDYAALARDQQQLDGYLQQVAAAPFEELGRNEKLALLINAYNAFTLRLILDHYPLKSIKDIPAKQRWDGRTWQVGKHRWTLNQIEHEQICPKFAEPRIHFALVCAAMGCPPLRQDAYQADRLEEQLEERARYVHSRDRWLRYDPQKNRIWLTSLYNWYGGDFEQAAGGLVLNYVARYSPDLKQNLEAGRKPRIQFLEYDWSLNSVEKRN